MKRILVLVAALAATMVVVPVAASAQAAGSAESFRQCRDIEKRSERLKCYDAAADAVFGVDEAVVAQREAAKEDEFGAERIKESRKSRSDDGGAARVATGDDKVKEITSRIAAYEFSRVMGEGLIRLDNGQVWRTNSNGTLLGRMKEGDQVVIKKAVLGGYQLTIEGKTGMQRVSRVK